MKTIIVIAAPGRSVPLPPSIARAPNGAQVLLLSSPPAGREPHAHELQGELAITLGDAAGAAYVRRRIAAGDLAEKKPAAGAAAKERKL